MSSEETSESDQDAPQPRFREDVPKHFVDEYDNPWVEVIDHPGRRKKIGASTLWDREYDQPIVEGMLWYGDVGDFWSLYHAMRRFKSSNEPAEGDDA